MFMLRVGEEVSLFGLSQTEYNSKCGWIVSSLDHRGRNGVWLGDPSQKPISIRSEHMTAVEAAPFDLVTSSLSGHVDSDDRPQTKLSSAEIKRAFADNLERPLRALLGRLSNPANFPSEALQIPGFIMDRLTALFEAWRKWVVAGISRECTYDQYGSAIDNFARERPGEMPVIFFNYSSFRELRKQILRFVANDAVGDCGVLQFNSTPLSAIFGWLDDGSSFREQLDCLKLLHGLCPRSAEELTSSDHRRPVGVALVLKLDEFVQTALADTFVETQVTVDLNQFRRTVKHNPWMRMAAENLATPARVDALRELNSASFEDQARLYTASRCALCDVSHPLQSSGIKLKVCARCNVAEYCCKEHQKEHWQIHKQHCRNLRDFYAKKRQIEPLPGALGRPVVKLY